MSQCTHFFVVIDSRRYLSLRGASLVTTVDGSMSVSAWGAISLVLPVLHHVALGCWVIVSSLTRVITSRVFSFLVSLDFVFSRLSGCPIPLQLLGPVFLFKEVIRSGLHDLLKCWVYLVA